MERSIWDELYHAAMAVIRPRQVSRVIEAGGVAAAVESASGKVLPPCGACRELMVQLMPETYRDVEVLMDYGTGRAVTLGELTPEWWL